MDFQFTPESEHNPEENLSGIVHTPGVTDFSSPHTLGEGAPLKPGIEGGALEGMGGPAKPTLHIGEPKVISDFPQTTEAATPEGGSVSYHYGKFGQPVSATKFNANGGFESTHEPEDINFPPHPLAQPAPTKPVLHVGEAEPYPISGTALGKTADGGSILYDYGWKGEPVSASVYDATGNWKATHYPDSIAFPPAPKAPIVEKDFTTPFAHYKEFDYDKPEFEFAEPVKQMGKLTAYTKLENGNNIQFLYHPSGKPFKAEELASNGDIIKSWLPEDINFPQHPLKQVPWKAEKPSVTLPKLSLGPKYEEEPIEELYTPLEDKTYPKLAPVTPLTVEEHQAVRDYTGNKYSGLAEHVYHGGTDPQHDDTIDVINSAINKHPLQEPMRLYRGVSGDVFNKFAKAEPGQAQVQTGFLSASTREEFANNWKSGKKFIIDMPAGMKGLPVDSFSHHEGEKEIIFQTGSKLEMVGRPDQNTLHLKFVPRETRAKWIEPSTNSIEHEYDIEYQKHFKTDENDPYPSFAEFHDAVKEAPVVTISKEQDQQIANRSRSSTISNLLSLIKSYVSYPQYRNEGTLEDLRKRIVSGLSVHMPIVVKLPGGQMRVLSGNTRLDINFMHHNEADVKLLDLSNGR